VNASPLVLTVSTAASITATTAIIEPLIMPAARISSTVPVARHSRRIGPSRLPARSDHQPTPSRIAAPPTWATASRGPADDVLHPRSLTR
jgi:hypothetical protein